MIISTIITRVVHGYPALIYCETDSRDGYVFTPDKIIGYAGEELRKIGFKKKARIDIFVNENPRVEQGLQSSLRRLPMRHLPDRAKYGSIEKMSLESEVKLLIHC
jgi:hypothetical protein